MLPVESAFKVYTDLNGNPLDNGYIYFGLPNQNPITAPVTVYWDAAGTQPAAQPLRTQDGYIVRSGTPANVFYGGAYSQIVQDKNRRQIYYARNSDDYSIANVVNNLIANLASSVGSSLIGFIQTGVGAVMRTVLDRLLDRVSVFDFMTTAQKNDVRAYGYSVDVTAAVQAALTAHRRVYAPEGGYLCSADITIPNDRVFFGAGTNSTNFRFTHTGDGFKNINPLNGSYDAALHMYDLGAECTNGANTGGGFTQVCASMINVERCRFKGFKYGIIFDQTEVSRIRDCDIAFNTTGGIWLVNGADHSPGASFRFTNRIEITGCEFNANPIHIIDDGGANHLIFGNNFNGGTNSIRIAGAQLVTILNNEIEGASAISIITSNVTQSTSTGVSYPTNVTIDGCLINAANGQPAISFGGGTNVKLANNLYQGNAANYAVTGVANVNNMVSENNQQLGFTIGVLDAIAVVARQNDSGFQQTTYHTYYTPNRLVSSLAVYVPANNGGGSDLGGIDLQGNNGANTKVNYARIVPATFDNTAGAEIGAINFKMLKAGADTLIYRFKTTEFLPSPDNTLGLGNSSFRWSVVYAGTGAINTSDAREKEQARSLVDAEKAVAIAIKGTLKAFKFRDAVAQKGDNARWHFGVYAQEVADCFRAQGLDPHEYALFCYDEWGATPEEFDGEGNLIQEALPAGNRYGIRYDELLAFLLASM